MGSASVDPLTSPGPAWHDVGPEAALDRPGDVVAIEVEGEPVVVVRGPDGVVRGFYNVCRHRGTAVVDVGCGHLVRFQCPYHAWIYDLRGRLVRARHTDDLDDFSYERFSLVPVATEVRHGRVRVSLNLEPSQDGAR